MKNLLQEFDDLGSEEDKDKLLSEAVNQMLDERLKVRLRDKLQDEYGIRRQPQLMNKRMWISVVSVAASIMLLIWGINHFGSNNDLKSDMYTLVHQQYLDHPGLSKGVVIESDQNRTIAITAFNDLRFEHAASLFSDLFDKSNEDVFYEATANLYSGNYSKAISTYRLLRQRDVGQFDQEINWFLAAALLLNGEAQEALENLKAIRPSEWHYVEAKVLTEEMESMD